MRRDPGRPTSEVSMSEARPFTPETLAERWGVSAASVRNQCAAGTLPHFRFGRLYRIPARAVEEIEACQTFPSDASAEASASTGPSTESEPVIALRHAPERRRKQRP
ncbi:DNA-binding protein [Cereibacter sphaeroides]|uniref:helix-turn-helix domain-containing protein n=1 Tax=Cereibacter azotoformans TaxID=43057 RepID=UPI000E35AFF4|nr:DNA-binding protein [Cereibacter sphaeroides]